VTPSQAQELYDLWSEALESLRMVGTGFHACELTKYITSLRENLCYLYGSIGELKAEAGA